MDIGRVLRHWMLPDWRLRQSFPPAVLARIEAAVAESERGHSGQVRFAVEGSLDTLPLLRGESARERALEVFSQLRVWDTEANNGVLIYLLLADHDVEIVADRGIHRRVGAAGWEAICRQMEQAFRAGHFEQGVVAGLQAVGAELARYFPAGTGPGNELPDTPVVL